MPTAGENMTEIPSIPLMRGAKISCKKESCLNVGSDAKMYILTGATVYKLS
jgi:hypothetical protein